MRSLSLIYFCAFVGFVLLFTLLMAKRSQLENSQNELVLAEGRLTESRSSASQLALDLAKSKSELAAVKNRQPALGVVVHPKSVYFGRMFYVRENNPGEIAYYKLIFTDEMYNGQLRKYGEQGELLADVNIESFPAGARLLVGRIKDAKLRSHQFDGGGEEFTITFSTDATSISWHGVDDAKRELVGSILKSDDQSIERRLGEAVEIGKQISTCDTEASKNKDRAYFLPVITSIVDTAQHGQLVAGHYSFLGNSFGLVDGIDKIYKGILLGALRLDRTQSQLQIYNQSTQSFITFGERPSANLVPFEVRKGIRDANGYPTTYSFWLRVNNQPFESSRFSNSWDEVGACHNVLVVKTR